MIYTIKKLNPSEDDYIMFMIHSSELCYKTNPFFNTKSKENMLYSDIENLFKFLKKQGYVGITLKEYHEKKR